MIQERKENAQKRRREKYNTETPKTMVDMIKERAQKEEEDTKEIVATDAPLPPTERLSLLVSLMNSCKVSGRAARASERQDRDVAEEPHRGCEEE